LWLQVLWCDNLEATGNSSSSSSSSGSSQRKQQQQQQLVLKRAFREVGGLLMSQLHDRNCTREFCPPGAFLADSLAPGRLQQEVQAAAARGGVGALGADSEDEEASGDPSASLQQQQHWHQQRGAGVEAAAAAADRESDEEEGDEGLGAGMEEGQPWAATAAGRTSHSRGSTFSQGESGSAQMQQVRAVLMPGFPPAAAAVAAGAGSSSSSSSAGGRVWQVLQHAPCLIPFQDRVQLFQSVVAAEKENAAATAAGGGSNPFVFDDSLDQGFMQPMENRFVTIR
jgi:hypothetical protein